MNSTLGLAAIAFLKLLSANSQHAQMHPYDIVSLKKRAKEYKDHAKVLRQINSDKMEWCRFYKNWLDISIFIFTLVLTFLSFYGVDKVSKLYAERFVNSDMLQFIFNILILLVLILTAIQMAAKLGERQVQHFGTVQRLTDFITDIDDLLLVDQITNQGAQRKIEDLNQKYKGITSSLPENSDKEWATAKRHLEAKKREKLKAESSPLSSKKEKDQKEGHVQ